VTGDRILTFCAGFFVAVVVLTIADAIDKESPRGAAVQTFKQGAWTMLLIVCVAAIAVTMG